MDAGAWSGHAYDVPAESAGEKEEGGLEHHQKALDETA